MYLQKTIELLRSEIKEGQKSQEERDKEIYKRLTCLQIVEAQLKVKSGAWGTIGAIAVLAVAWIAKKLTGG